MERESRDRKHMFSGSALLPALLGMTGWFAGPAACNGTRRQEQSLHGEATTAAMAALAAVTADPTCGTAVAPLGTCHPSACTSGFCARGDIASLPGALRDRLGTIDCGPH